MFAFFCSILYMWMTFIHIAVVCHCSFAHSYCCTVFHYMNTYHNLLIHAIAACWVVSILELIMNGAVGSVLVHVFWWTCVPTSGGYKVKSRMLGLRVFLFMHLLHVDIKLGWSSWCQCSFLETVLLRMRIESNHCSNRYFVKDVLSTQTVRKDFITETQQN